MDSLSDDQPYGPPRCQFTAQDDGSQLCGLRAVNVVRSQFGHQPVDIAFINLVAAGFSEVEASLLNTDVVGDLAAKVQGDYHIQVLQWICEADMGLRLCRWNNGDTLPSQLNSAIFVNTSGHWVVVTPMLDLCWVLHNDGIPTVVPNLLMCLLQYTGGNMALYIIETIPRAAPPSQHALRS